MKTFLPSFLFIFLLQLSATADNYLFKVFYVKGEVVLNHNSKSSALEKDNLVYSGDKVTLAEKSTVVFLNTKNISLVIEKAGSYTAKKIGELFQNIDNENITQKYFNFVVEEFMHHHGEKTYTGAVSRGESIEMLNPKDSCIVINNEIIFQWDNPENKDLWFFIYSEAEERLFEGHGKVSALAIFVDKSNLNIGETYLWMVSTNQYPSETDLLNVFTIADKKQKQLFEKDMNVIKERFTNSRYNWDMETNNLLLYGFFMENRLFIEANQTKKKIMDNYPDSPFFIE